MLKYCNTYLEMLKSVQNFLVHAFSYLFVTPMDLCYLFKLQLFILYLNKYITKFLDLFKGGGKNSQTAAVFIGRFCLLLFWAFIWVSRWLFLSLLIFSECWQLNTLYEHLETNFIWGFICSTYIIFMPSNTSHSKKEVGNSFVVKFFHREEKSLSKESSK
jgi:hypothetical protein